MNIKRHVAPWQVLKREPAAKLLLCAPQNYSADLLASALSAKIPTSDMLRLNDPRRPPNQARLPLLHAKCSATVIIVGGVLPHSLDMNGNKRPPWKWATS